MYICHTHIRRKVRRFICTHTARALVGASAGAGCREGKKRVFPRSYPHVFPNKNERKKEEKNREAPDSSHAKKGEKHIEIEREGGAFSDDAYFPANAVLEKKIRKCNYESPFSAALYTQLNL